MAQSPTELARLLAFGGALFHSQAIDYSLLLLNRHFSHFCGAILLLKHEALSRILRISPLIDLSDCRRRNGTSILHCPGLSLLSRVVLGGTVFLVEPRTVIGPVDAEQWRNDKSEHVPLSLCSPHGECLGSNTGLHSDRPFTRCLSCGAQ